MGDLFPTLSRQVWLFRFAIFITRSEQQLDMRSASEAGESWYPSASQLSPEAAAVMYLSHRNDLQPAGPVGFEFLINEDAQGPGREMVSRP